MVGVTDQSKLTESKIPGGVITHNLLFPLCPFTGTSSSKTPGLKTGRLFED